MIWDYKSKLMLFAKFEDKFNSNLEKFTCEYCISVWDANHKQKPRTNPKKWNEYLDQLDCERIVRTRMTGWEYEDKIKDNNFSGKWKSLNKPGFVHISNPVWPGNFHKSDHIIRLSKEIAQKVLVLGLP